ARNRVVLTASRDVARHDLADRLSERVRPMFGQRAHDIAFRQYAGETPSRATDQDCAYTVRGEQFSRRRQIGSRLDANDVATQVAFLGGQDRLDVHGSLPCARLL